MKLDNKLKFDFEVFPKNIDKSKVGVAPLEKLVREIAGECEFHYPLTVIYIDSIVLDDPIELSSLIKGRDKAAIGNIEINETLCPLIRITENLECYQNLVRQPDSGNRLKSLIAQDSSTYVDALKYNYFPKIFIGTLDPAECKESQEQVYYKRLFELDNSIWTHYIPLCEKNQFIERLKTILKEIRDCYDIQLYSSVVCQEYLEIFSRIVAQNKIEHFGGHGSMVLPFISTSESVFRNKVDKCLERLRQNLVTVKEWNIQNLNWDIALIDDYADKNLNGVKSEIVTKRYILSNLIKNILRDIPEVQITIIPIDSIEKAQDELQNNPYDILLVDYLFSKEEQYGIDLFRTFLQSPVRGPFYKQWIIPISVFSNAFMDDMRNRDISNVHDSYQVVRGADFVNTPFLFLYYLVSIMNQQVEKVIKTVNILESVLPRSKDELTSDLDVEDYVKYYQEKNDIDNFLLRDKSKFSTSFKSYLPSRITLYSDKRKKSLIENLIYHRTFKNYKTNEELIILYDLLKGDYM